MRTSPPPAPRAQRPWRRERVGKGVPSSLSARTALGAPIQMQPTSPPRSPQHSQKRMARRDSKESFRANLSASRACVKLLRTLPLYKDQQRVQGYLAHKREGEGEGGRDIPACPPCTPFPPRISRMSASYFRERPLHALMPHGHDATPKETVIATGTAAMYAPPPRLCPTEGPSWGYPVPGLGPFPVLGAILLRIVCQKLTNLVKIDCEIPPRRAFCGEQGRRERSEAGPKSWRDP